MLHIVSSLCSFYSFCVDLLLRPPTVSESVTNCPSCVFCSCVFFSTNVPSIPCLSLCPVHSYSVRSFAFHINIPSIPASARPKYPRSTCLSYSCSPCVLYLPHSCIYPVLRVPPHTCSLFSCFCPTPLAFFVPRMSYLSPCLPNSFPSIRICPTYEPSIPRLSHLCPLCLMSVSLPSPNLHSVPLISPLSNAQWRIQGGGAHGS